MERIQLQQKRDIFYCFLSPLLYAFLCYLPIQRDRIHVRIHELME